jgi:hypothetical protein
LEGGPFQQDWWFEEAKGFVPYLNVEARWEGAPDQGMLQKKGGRGFPFSAIMNSDGEVIWEVRPTSHAALVEGLASARQLQALKERLAKTPDDKGLAASVELLAALGCSQRQTRPVEELEEFRAVKGIDAGVQERFDAWFEGKKFDDKISKAMEAAPDRDAVGPALLQLFKDGLRPPAASSRGNSFWFYAFAGAEVAKDKESAMAIVEAFAKSAADDSRTQGLLTSLREKLAAMD